MGDPDTQAGPVVRAGLQRVRELLYGLPVPAHALDGQDLALCEREDRLDVQELARPAGSAADASAACQVLERVEREDEPRLALEPCEQLVHLLVGRPPVEPALDREREHRDRRRSRAGVDDPHMRAARVRRSAARTV